jgi:uncharacterized membrane protein YfcA
MAGFFLVKQLQWMPGGGELSGLTGAKLAFAVAVNAVLGALMTLGIGMYAPCMILVALLGMNPKVAYPIMMGSCAFLLPVCGVRFIRKERYNLKAALGLAIGGIPGVLAAAFVVKELPLEWVRWLVIVVAVYSGGLHGDHDVAVGQGGAPASRCCPGRHRLILDPSLVVLT